LQYSFHGISLDRFKQSPLVAFANCRAALSGLPADQGSLHINIQGNLGALLLAGNEPAAAIHELEAALLEAQIQQLPLHQFAGLLFNLGKALTTVGRLQEADETYAKAAQAAFGHDLGSYAKAVAAPRSIGGDTAMQAVQASMKF
jgi:tetratricopeptide (TPR) repeat protein